MSRALPILLLAATLATVPAACDVDFTDVTDPSEGLPRIPQRTETHLSVDLAIDHRPLPELRLRAYLWPGTLVEGGPPRVVSNDTLYLGERALPPGETSDHGARNYAWGPGPGAEQMSLSITAPVVEGLPPLPSVRVRGHQRVGVDTIRTASGDTLRFETAPTDTAAGAPVQTSWNFILGNPDAILQRRDTTAVPGVLAVPGEWLTWAGSEPVHVQLTVRETWRREHADGEYTATIGVTSLVTWTVIWTDR